MKSANIIPGWLPRDQAFRVAPGTPEEEVPKIYDLINRISTLVEHRFELQRKSATRHNWLDNSGFRHVNGSAVPYLWSAAGAGVTYTQQTVRTGGHTLNKAIRVVTGAGAASTLTFSIAVFPGQRFSLAGWYKINSGSGEVTLVSNGTNAVTSRYPLTKTGGWLSLPANANDNSPMVEMPTDATTLTLTLRTEVSSSIEYCEFQVGHGTQRIPHLWVESINDGLLHQVGVGTAGEVVQSDGDGTYSLTTISSGGISTLYSTLNQTATTAVVTEEILGTYEIPANTITAEDQYIDIHSWGSVAANTNTKTIRCRFGSGLLVLVYNDAVPNPSGQAWDLKVRLGLRTGPGLMTATGTMTVGGVTQSVTNTTPNSDVVTNPIDIYISGQNGTASAGDILMDGLTVEFSN